MPLKWEGGGRRGEGADEGGWGGRRETISNATLSPS